MAQTIRVKVAKPTEYATFEMTEDFDGQPDEIIEWMVADRADSLDAMGKLEWELPDWTVEVVDYVWVDG
jgi:hypothetical protein